MMPPTLILAITVSLAPSHCHVATTASQDTIRLYRETHRDLTGDGIPEFLSVEAVGVTWKEMTVRLQIHADDEELLYFDEWYTRDYFYAPLPYNPNTPEGSERLVTSCIGEVLGDDSFRQGIHSSYGVTEARSRSMRGTIRNDLVEYFWRERNGKTLRDRIFERPGFFEYRGQYLPLVSDERIEALAEELEFGLTFWYSNGHDSLLVIAWSKSEGRFVTVLSS